MLAPILSFLFSGRIWYGSDGVSPPSMSASSLIFLLLLFFITALFLFTLTVHLTPQSVVNFLHRHGMVCASITRTKDISIERFPLLINWWFTPSTGMVSKATAH